MDAGLEDGGSSERGGGGMGALFASPIRRRVMVSWALVGTPLRIVLRRISQLFGILRWVFDILSDLKQLLPVGEILVQQIKTTPNEWITKETETDNCSRHFHEHGRGGEQANSDGWNQNTTKFESRRLLGKGRSG